MRKKFGNLLLIVCCFLLTFSSCIQYKKVPYYKNVSGTSDSASIGYNYTDPVIQKNDILKITVSSLDQDVTRLFSFNAEDQMNSFSNSSGSSYLVDPQGYIRMPLIGPVNVEGKTTWSVRDTITRLLQPYLKETVVEIRITSFRITVSGDVAKPGVYSTMNERLTLTEALTMAGDLNISGIRNNVLLIRDENGQRKYIRFDLSDKNIYNSPYFYLRSNDVVYVQPGKIVTRDINFRNLTYLATIVSLIAVIISITQSN
jgi:polysaccharide export outer membrane protein